MKRTLILMVMATAAVAAFVLMQSQSRNITLSNAQLVPVHGQNGSFVGILTIDNSGPADRLLGAEISVAGNIALIQPEAGYDLVMPGVSVASLASDGAHLMVTGLQQGVAEGSFVPLTLVFGNAGPVVARAQVVGMGAMDHGQGLGHDAPKAMHLSLTPYPEADKSGLSGKFDAGALVFAQKPDGAGHIAGEGHAHLYLNGLKLGRLYTTSYAIGALLPGSYRMRISLNANDHKPYTNAQGPMTTTFEFQLNP